MTSYLSLVKNTASYEHVFHEFDGLLKLIKNRATQNQNLTCSTLISAAEVQDKWLKIRSNLIKKNQNINKKFEAIELPNQNIDFSKYSTFVHLGGAKCASTYLQNAFSLVPDIEYFGPNMSPKEVNLFNKQILNSLRWTYDGYQQYDDLIYESDNPIYQLWMTKVGSQKNAKVLDSKKLKKKLPKKNQRILISAEGYTYGNGVNRSAVYQKLNHLFPNNTPILVIRNQYELFESLVKQLYSFGFYFSCDKFCSFLIENTLFYQCLKNYLTFYEIAKDYELHSKGKK